MKNEDEKLADFAEHTIIRQARMLDKEIQPENDLWPEISNRIRGLPQQENMRPVSGRWMPMAVAASMFVAVGALTFAGYINYSVKQQRVPIIADQSTIDLIEQPFTVARTSYLTRLATEEQQMSPEVREVLKKNLKIIDDAAREIRQALKENPNDTFLTDALLQTRQKELALLNQVTSHGPDTI